MNFKIPEMDEKKQEEISNLKVEINKLERIIKHEIPGQVEGYKKGLMILNKEAEKLKEKAGFMPEIFDKEYKGKVKEIGKVEALIQTKTEELNKVNDKYFMLKNETLRKKEDALYIPYLIELNQLFWELQGRAFKENDKDLNEPLNRILKIINYHPLRQYMNIATRPDPKAVRVLTPELKRY